MRLLSSLRRTILGEWSAGVVMVALVCAPVSCTLPSVNLGDGDAFGMLINSNTASNVLGGIQLRDGRSAYLYGSFAEDGSVQELTEAVIEEADGGMSSLKFENGRPAKAVTSGGSTVDITYEEATAQRLKGEVVVFVASNGETLTLPFDIDLEKAAAEIAQIVEDLTGVEISEAEPPEEPEDIEQARLITSGGVKSDRAEVGVAVGLLMAFTFATAGFLLVTVMTQMMQAIALAVAATLQALIYAIFLPFIILGELMRMAVTQPLLTINVEVGGGSSGVPARPTF
jgi:hypothetical protein